VEAWRDCWEQPTTSFPVDQETKLLKVTTWEGKSISSKCGEKNSLSVPHCSKSLHKYVVFSWRKENIQSYQQPHVVLGCVWSLSMSTSFRVAVRVLILFFICLYHKRFQTVLMTQY
jgi:hypothetical protein